MFQKIFKEGNGDSKYLRCPDLLDNNLEVLNSEIYLYKEELVFSETVKAKPNGNYSYFITYLNIIYFYGIWLNISGFLRTK